MLRAFVAILAAGLWCLAATALADRVNTQISFAGWTIETSENVWAGARHRSYPIENLVDGRIDTAWVYSGIDYPKPVVKEGNHLPGDYLIEFRPNKPILIDHLRIWNGYQKSRELFHKNSRAAVIEIYDGHPEDYIAEAKLPPSDPDTERKRIWKNALKSVRLAGDMGPTDVELPSKKYKSLWIRVRDIHRGEIDDLCISEIRLMYNGKSLIPAPSVYSATDGDECG